MSNTTILFIPGSYVLLDDYLPLFSAVTEAGISISGLHPSTVGLSPRQGRDGPAPSMYEDAAVIAAEAERLADQGKDVILMGHSYAGIPISQCTDGLSKAERKAQGKRGGVVRLAYMSSLVPQIGQSAASLIGSFGEGHKPAVSVDENGWMLMEDPPATANMICQDIPAEEGTNVVRNFAKHSARSFGDELTHAGYKDIPSSYLLCDKDQAGPLEFQLKMIDMIEGVSGMKVDTTHIQAGHCPYLSKLQETVDWIVHVAKKAREDQSI